MSREESWFTDSLIDIGISVGLYFLPGGFFVSLGASILLAIFDNKIEKIKDDFYEEWFNFLEFFLDLINKGENNYENKIQI